ncbi:M23 family metallopeptidase [Catellatospora aurea]|uniref:M23 family metallopeptidase n=1 Tax=Catellatospora aurea TaxID=1337874 RepID=A0ABW2GZ76_9ACTN
MLATAAAGAGVVAFATGAAVDDAKGDAADSAVAAYVQAGGATSDRAQAADRANRAERTTETTAESTVTWKLPLHDYDLAAGVSAGAGHSRHGLDLTGLPEGTPFAAMRAGTVVQAGWNGAFGNSVIIDHGDGVQTVYAHASHVLVKRGQQVEAGQAIALLGNTGLSRNVHLHLELYVDGVLQDPLSWFKERGVDFELEIEALPS